MDDGVADRDDVLDVAMLVRSQVSWYRAPSIHLPNLLFRYSDTAVFCEVMYVHNVTS